MTDQHEIKPGKPELILPAGSFEKLTYAVAYGADAVYAGPPETSLRARKNSFSLRELPAAVDYCHQRGVRLYVTINIFPRQSDIPHVERAVEEAAASGADALIVSDPGVVRLINKKNLPVPVHVSTQANCTSLEGLRFWADQGAGRVILARELVYDEVAELAGSSPIQTEIFVHGAMCISYSGRCLLSDFLAGREANRGACAGSCRWRYFLSEESRPDDPLVIEQSGQGSFILNSRDLCLLEDFPLVRRLPVSGYKIEGRTKNLLYLAVTGFCYRRAVDTAFTGGEIDPGLKRILELTDHHGFTGGFLLPDHEVKQQYDDSGLRRQNLLGHFLDADGERVVLKVKNPVSEGEAVAISPGSARVVTVRSLEVDGHRVDTAYGSLGHVAAVRLDPPLRGDEWEFGILARKPPGFSGTV
jgi:putative protease